MSELLAIFSLLLLLVAWWMQELRNKYLETALRCYQCGHPINGNDDDARICINCGGRNRRI